MALYASLQDETLIYIIYRSDMIKSVTLYTCTEVAHACNQEYPNEEIMSLLGALTYSVYFISCVPGNIRIYNVMLLTNVGYMV